MRLGSTPSRALEFDLAHAPFGEIYASSGTLHPAFTGQRQDTVAGLFDFPAREYSTQGRWPSPDPAGLAAVDSTNPQSWNRYAYVLNNPLALVDPLGMNDCAPGEHTCANNNGGIPDEGGIDLFGANNFWDGTPYIGLGGGNNGVNRPISIPIFMPTGLYLQGSFLLDGVPVLIPDTFWVSNAINHDTWNIPIVTQGVTLYYPLSGPGGGRGGGGGGGGRNTGANPGMCYAKPTEKCDAEYYACVQKATAGAVGTGSGLIAAGGAAFELGKVGCVGAGEFEAGCLGIMEIFSDSWLYFSLGTGRASYDSRVADCDNQRAKCYAQTCQ
jgi:RHS repeat-associated protein